MTVKELIKYLQKFPQDIDVAYSKYSEFCLLETAEIQVMGLFEYRPDGWVHDPRPDKSEVSYLVFPGN